MRGPVAGFPRSSTDAWIVDLLMQTNMWRIVMQAQNINDKDFLKGAAEAAGLPKDGAAAVLNDPDAFSEQVAIPISNYR